MSKIENIKDFIWEHIDEEYGNVVEDDRFETVKELIEFVNKQFEVNLSFKTVGNYISCGYDMWCYAWAGIVDGELYFDSLMRESY